MTKLMEKNQLNDEFEMLLNKQFEKSLDEIGRAHV